MRRPENIHCLALNFPGVGKNCSDAPLYFVKSRQAFCASGVRIVFPAGVESFWTEVELGIVIARRGVNIPQAEAAAHIRGYVVCADLSCENVHGRDHHLAFSKSRAGFCPCGNIVKRLASSTVERLKMFTEINGRVTQTGCVGDMTMKPAAVVSYLSGITPLEQGDLILTGTPPGHQNNMLKRGDHVRNWIELIGEVSYDII